MNWISVLKILIFGLYKSGFGLFGYFGQGTKLCLKVERWKLKLNDHIYLNLDT